MKPWGFWKRHIIINRWQSHLGKLMLSVNNGCSNWLRTSVRIRMLTNNYSETINKKENPALPGHRKYQIYGFWPVGNGQAACGFRDVRIGGAAAVFAAGPSPAGCP